MTHPTNFDAFERSFPLLALACKAVDYEGTANSTELYDVLIGTATDRRFSEAERELEKISAPAFWNVVNADPGEELPFAPIACRVLTAIFA